jgi:hypothetical protein
MTNRVRLVLLSGLMLFVELALIRWTGSNVLHLSYFSNFVLLGSFLGIGIGFLRADKKRSLFPFAPIALALLIVIVRVFPSGVDRHGGDIIYFTATSTTGLPAYVILPLVFAFVAAIMAFIADGVAKTFVLFDALEAYRLDILGSICGITLFSALSFLRTPPIVWGAIVCVILLLLLRGSIRYFQIIPILLILVALGQESFIPNKSWSPYYAIKTSPFTTSSGSGVLVSANGVPHQNIVSTEYRKKAEPLYFEVYNRLVDNPLNDVLIIGAGNGSDTAIALQQGAKHVDAVEIDPRLYELGKKLHPDHPYDDPRVSVHINDGRAFLERTNKKYDLILLSLPDSLTLVSGQSSLRLESYLFTQQAMNTAVAHLQPQGAFAMYNYYREGWLVDRLARTSEVANGHAPCLDTVHGVSGFALLTNSPSTSAVHCATTWKQVDASVKPTPATDNHPFLYLRDRTLPSLYVETLLPILLASLLLTRRVAGSFSSMRNFADLFFMGAAFLLLETKNVVQFSLLFGTTWFVNALVFLGILVSVYLAVETARHVRVSRSLPLYLLLLASLVVAWIVPPSSLLRLDMLPRFGLAVLLAFFPVYIANLVFAERFKAVGSTTTAFGANLLGAMLGGMIEYSALIIGYRSLLIVAAVLYACAFLTGRRHFATADV